MLHRMSAPKAEQECKKHNSPYQHSLLSPNRMDFSENTTAITITETSLTSSFSPTSSNSSPNSPPSVLTPVILTPCAACKILRRRCIDKCVLAPYFPPTEPIKFTIAHRVFGASNIIKLLQELPEDQRADAVNSMVYEANARLRDPVYGCAGAICQLQKQINELQAELAKSQAEMLNMQLQNASLFDLICKQVDTQHLQQADQAPILPYDHDGNTNFFFDENALGVAWDPLWT